MKRIDWTEEDALITRRAIMRGQFATFNEMVENDDIDAMIMYEREEAKQFDREYGAYLEREGNPWWQDQDSAMEAEPEGNYHNSYHRP